MRPGQLEDLLRGRVDQLARLTRLSEAVVRAATPEETYAAALDCLEQTLSPDRASVLLFDDDGVMRFRAWRGLSDAYRAATEGHSPWSRSTRDPEPVLVEDVAGEPSLSGLADVIEAEGIRALGFFPLLAGDRLLGKFMVYFDEPHAFTSLEIRLAQAIGAHITLEIGRHQAEEALRHQSAERRRAQARASFLAAASEALGSSLDYRATLNLLADLAVPFVCDTCAVDVLEDGLLGRAALAGPGEPPLDAGRLDEELVHPTCLRLPLAARGRNFGAITFDAAASGRRFEPEDVVLARDLARRAAVSADHGLLHEAEQRARDAAERLQTVTQVLAGALTTGETAAAVVREGAAALGAAAGWLAAVDHDARELRRIAALGYQPQLVDAYTSLPLEPGSPTADAVLDQRALWLESADDVVAAYPGLAADYARAGFEAMAVVPLVVAGRSTGVIALNFDEPRTFRADERRLLLALAAQCGQGLERATLYAQLEERADAASVLAHVGDGVFQLDLDERVILWNRGAEVITGIGEREALGRLIGEVMVEWEAIRPRISITELPIAVGRRPALPVVIRGREFWIAISGVETREGIVYAFRDVTEAEKLEKARRDFLATVSHELRTPLAGVFGATKTLIHRQLDEQTKRDLLGIIDSESQRLAAILDEILFASSLDAGAVGVDVRGCDVLELTREVLSLERTRTPSTVSLTLDAAGSVPSVMGDPAKLRQVLVNLVDNAIKYSPEGGAIVVSVRPLEDAVRISVADHGLGIPPGEEERIFEKFYRLDPELSRGVGGTGLGLYISREFVERMKGRIWVRSLEGRGSTFHVELPLDR